MILLKQENCCVVAKWECWGPPREAGFVFPILSFIYSRPCFSWKMHPSLLQLSCPAHLFKQKRENVSEAKESSGKPGVRRTDWMVQEMMFSPSTIRLGEWTFEVGVGPKAKATESAFASLRTLPRLPGGFWVWKCKSWRVCWGDREAVTGRWIRADVLRRGHASLSCLSSAETRADVASSRTKIHLVSCSSPTTNTLFVFLVFWLPVFLTGQESFHTVPCRELLNNTAIESEFSAQVMKFITWVFCRSINCDTDSSLAYHH